MATSLEFVSVESLVGMYQFHFLAEEEETLTISSNKKPWTNPFLHLPLVVDDDVGDASCAGYRGGMRVLSVGDGDFSFSLAISKVVLSSSPPFGNDDGVDYYDHVGGGEGEDEDGNHDGGSKEEEDEIVEEGKGRGVGRRDRDRGMVVATSYENEETLQSVYPYFDINLRELTVRGGGGDVVVAYNVDNTAGACTEPSARRN